MKNVAAVHLVLMCVISCNNAEQHEYKKNAPPHNTEDSVSTHYGWDTSLPFVGKRWFETRPGVSGSGTPRKYVEIKKNRDVFFSYEQQNQADRTITKEQYYAGKYKRFMKCVFTKIDTLITCYEFLKDTIYEVNASNERLKSDECCNIGEPDGKKVCICKGELSPIE